MNWEKPNTRVFILVSQILILQIYEILGNLKLKTGYSSSHCSELESYAWKRERCNASSIIKKREIEQLKWLLLRSLKKRQWHQGSFLLIMWEIFIWCYDLSVCFGFIFVLCCVMSELEKKGMFEKLKKYPCI